MKSIIIIFLLFFYSFAKVQQYDLGSQAKDTLITPTIQNENIGAGAEDVFKKVEMGIKTGRIDEYEKNMNNLVSITIGSNEQGYYSANQALSILLGYFSERHPISFDFSKVHETGSSPYATGRYVYLKRGVQESAQIYVSLTLQDSIWVIGQFNIY